METRGYEKFGITYSVYLFHLDESYCPEIYPGWQNEFYSSVYPIGFVFVVAGLDLLARIGFVHVKESLVRRRCNGHGMV